MAQQFAAHRHPPKHREDQAAQRVGLLIALFRQEIDTQELLKLVDTGTRIGDE